MSAFATAFYAAFYFATSVVGVLWGLFVSLLLKAAMWIVISTPRFIAFALAVSFAAAFAIITLLEHSA